MELDDVIQRGSAYWYLGRDEVLRPGLRVGNVVSRTGNHATIRTVQRRPGSSEFAPPTVQPPWQDGEPVRPPPDPGRRDGSTQNAFLSAAEFARMILPDPKPKPTPRLSVWERLNSEEENDADST